MSEKEKKILDTFANDVIPHLSDLDKEKLLAFGEGLGNVIKLAAKGELRENQGAILEL